MCDQCNAALDDRFLSEPIASRPSLHAYSTRAGEKHHVPGMLERTCHSASAPTAFRSKARVSVRRAGRLFSFAAQLAVSATRHLITLSALHLGKP